MPESPRWLITKNRTDDAYTIFKRIAKSNKRSIPDTCELFMVENKNGAFEENNSKAVETVRKAFLRSQKVAKI
jgi:hypothetical protein